LEQVEQLNGVGALVVLARHAGVHMADVRRG
jgi:hypothetical protein